MIQLNYRDVRPFYEQIKDEIRRMVIAGAVETDEKLPSVRELAARLTINPNTIQRAYRELEQEGYIYRVRGKGTYAAPQAQVQDERVRMLQQQYQQVVTELLYLNIPREELQRWMDELGQEVQHDTGQ
ncbi:MAG: GntR family transcriptional regulator [Lachnospiraceae bacterium]|nr:GntR family transcriptional regulator [Lachnospiraceae bacterium]MDE7434867.1 GntR family transcriptional regulator [Lachnospiraceae bacterium]